MKCNFMKFLPKQEKGSKKRLLLLHSHQSRSINISFILLRFDAKEIPAELYQLEGKASMEEMKIDTHLINNPKLTQIDQFGIAHFYPQEQPCKYYQKFCTGWQQSLSINEIISVVNSYTDKDTLLCTRINLLLASDSEQLSEYAKLIKQLKYSIYKLADAYKVKVSQVFRGMDSSQQEFDSFPLGKTIYLPSFTSTSKNPEKFYSNQKQNTLIIINLKKQPLGAFIVTKKYSKNSENDEEVLFSCYSKFLVARKEVNYSFAGKQFKFYIELEHINQMWAQLQQNDQNTMIQAMVFGQFAAIK